MVDWINKREEIDILVLKSISDTPEFKSRLIKLMRQYAGISEKTVVKGCGGCRHYSDMTCNLHPKAVYYCLDNKHYHWLAKEIPAVKSYDTCKHKTDVLYNPNNRLFPGMFQYCSNEKCHFGITGNPNDCIGNNHKYWEIKP